MGGWVELLRQQRGAIDVGLGVEMKSEANFASCIHLFYSMDALLKSSFSIFSTNPKFLLSKNHVKPFKVSIKPPPPDIDFIADILAESTVRIGQTYPQLADLAENGALVLVEKR
ncbi:Detected protein of unknown function [Hibiscus syriacus]|uniref:Uncharacterized protein n=1 Tax=Hibiscus syriacus TaxID=106335 RepID=A0A6A3AQX0_HIBSY|nr:Detected protein of unknown function [Hibiscus syriacus]